MGKNNAKKKKREVRRFGLDTEDDGKGNPFLINFFDGVEHFTFETRAGAIGFLGELTGSIEIWCTNLGYDLNNLFGDAIQMVEITYAGSRVISAKVVGSQIRFKDTLNHWKISVAEMGKRIGLKKLDSKGNFNDVRYCRRDTEITYKFVETMASKYVEAGAKLKTTIGSTALDFFYEHFHPRPTTEEIPSEKEMEFILSGYYGGRTEIFFNAPVEGRITYVDINSLYPSVMRDFEYPVLHSRRFKKRPDFSKEGMVDVTIKAPQLEVPYLPHRDPDTYRLIFPVGQFRGTYTYFEIREAEKIGYRVKKVHNALEYTCGVYRPFQKFVDGLYAERLKADAAGDELLKQSYKDILNNTYGKFGQGNEITKLIPFDREKLKSGDEVFGGMVLQTIEGDYPRHSNGVWAAYTTAYSRHRLFQGLEKVRLLGGLLIYCDTDSVIFESASEIFPNSKNLGEFKIEGLFKYAHFKLPKLYCLIEANAPRRTYRAKGVPRCLDKFNHDEKCECGSEAFFETGRATFRRPYKLREVLRRNLSPKRVHKLIPNYWETVEKVTYQKYDKRLVLPKGFTKPLEVRF